MSKIVVELTPRQVDAYWAMSALYSCEYEDPTVAEHGRVTVQNIKTHVPNLDQKMRDAMRLANA
jgi:hypothetical protein